MKNLENYGVQSLNAQEIRETEGGNPVLEWLIDEVIAWVEDGGLTDIYEGYAESCSHYSGHPAY